MCGCTCRCPCCIRYGPGPETEAEYAAEQDRRMAEIERLMRPALNRLKRGRQETVGERFRRLDRIIGIG